MSIVVASAALDTAWSEFGLVAFSTSTLLFQKWVRQDSGARVNTGHPLLSHMLLPMMQELIPFHLESRRQGRRYEPVAWRSKVYIHPGNIFMFNRSGSAAVIRYPLNLLLADLFLPPCLKISKKLMPRSGKVKTVKVHDLVPHQDKVLQELLLSILTSVDFNQGPELGIRTEDEVEPGSGPLEFARCPIMTLE